MPTTGRRFVPAVAAVAVVALASACSGTASGSSGHNLSLVAYSTPQAAYSALIPAFNQTAAGKDVTFSQSYDASGAQSRFHSRIQAVLADGSEATVQLTWSPARLPAADGHAGPGDRGFRHLPHRAAAAGRFGVRR